MSDTSNHGTQQALERACPSCQVRTGQLLLQQRFAEIEGVSIHAGYDVVACAGCGACFADGVPDQAAFDRYYREASKYEGSASGALPAATLQRFREEVADIERYLPARSARILEVGCATGALLGMLKERGYAAVCGLDPSPACAAIAHERYGVPVTTGELSGGLGDAHAPAGGYDVIVMIAVMEHVRDLTATLHSVRRALSRSGLLYLEVPDAMRFEHGADAPFQEFSVEHINYFSAQSLSALLQRHGFVTLDSLQRDRSHTDAGTAPVVAGVFRAADAAGDFAQPDLATASAIRAYVSQSERREQPVRAFAAALAGARRPVLVWGCGTLTLRLLATSALADANIAGFVDANARYWGKTIRGIEILAPDAVRGRSEPILVSSVGQQAAIARDLRAGLGDSREVLVYPSV